MSQTQTSLQDFIHIHTMDELRAPMEQQEINLRLSNPYGWLIS